MSFATPLSSLLGSIERNTWVPATKVLRYGLKRLKVFGLWKNAENVINNGIPGSTALSRYVAQTNEGSWTSEVLLNNTEPIVHHE